MRGREKRINIITGLFIERSKFNRILMTEQEQEDNIIGRHRGILLYLSFLLFFYICDNSSSTYDVCVEYKQPHLQQTTSMRSALNWKTHSHSLQLRTVGARHFISS